MTDFRITKHSLHVPDAQEVASLFHNKLTQYFGHVSCDVVDCPDLQSEPFYLAQSGLNGRQAICDVGGVPYLVPTAQKDKKYSLSAIADQLEYDEGAFFVGAGAGPCHVIGVNSELMPNFYCKGQVVRNGSHVAKLSTECAKGYQLSHIDEVAPGCDEFGLLGNLFLSEGKPGKVIHVNVKDRKSANNFVTSMRNVLKEAYGDLQVSMGGVFIMKSGTAKLHVMPDFSPTPLSTDQQVNDWLRYFEAQAPLICLSTFHSTDPGQDLRIEHTHCFSKHGDGGHYHYDVTPDQVEYEGFFGIANTVYRIDAPEQSHMIGRD